LGNTRLGYACINTTLQKQYGLTCNRGMIKRTFQAKGLEYASELALKNCKDIIPIMKWNAEHNIFVWRLSSEIFPWMSEYEFSELPDYNEICKVLADVGILSKELGVRLSFHPGPFNVLASPNEKVVAKTVRELNQHSEIFNLMGFEPSPENKVNIHIRATYGDKQTTGDRFIVNFDRLEEHTKKRLTLENDDKASQWSVVDLMRIHKATGVPIVFDYHHHRFCTGDLSEEEALKLASTTWPVNITQVVHYSESCKLLKDNGKSKMPQAHSQYIVGPILNYGLDIDCVIEAKMKEKTLLQYRGDEIEN
jgi:UV DNA damage endonuclease